MAKQEIEEQIKEIIFNWAIRKTRSKENEKILQEVQRLY
jgi:hypothetical protein